MDEFQLSTSDLILCANLLLADAREWERLTEAPEHQLLLKERAEDRRQLAKRMLAEVMRREGEGL